MSMTLERVTVCSSPCSKTKVHVIGWTQEMNLAIQVKNLGEDAFESLVKVQLPEGVSYINVLKVKSVSVTVSVSHVTHALSQSL